MKSAFEKVKDTARDPSSRYTAKQMLIASGLIAAGLLTGAAIKLAPAFLN